MMQKYKPKALKEGLSTFFASNKPTSTSSSTLTRPVVPKNGSTGKSQSDAVLPKNGSILINTINETDNEIINDTSIGFAQQTDGKNSQIPKTEVEWFKESFNRTFLTQQTIDYLCLFNDLNLTRQLIDQIFGEKRHVENMRVFGDKKMDLKLSTAKLKAKSSLQSQRILFEYLFLK